ncbi:MAG: translation initiation factor IF-2 [Chloroflexi bacterium]|nr:translation initiation factor IF-2 [Chloroflexota bacterium]HCU80835.1 translation initiation factor IF-2 [Chloroflexota bacterium]
MTEDKSARVIVPELVTVRELADLIEVSPIEVIKQLMANGVIANINQQIDYETAAIVAEEMGREVEKQDSEEELEEKSSIALPEWRKIIQQEDETDLEQRPPVVAILGHVDHGKTSLLDVIRRANVVEDEAGGITQHIGAYQINWEGRPITFLDTPGHAAFTAMRARGAQSTDIVVLVVAADDGVMPQTKEAIAHAQAAGVPIVVALNKIDVAGSNPERVKQQLSDSGLTTDEWDGDTMVVPVSAKDSTGIDDLLEAILLISEDIAIKANPNADGTGMVIESKIDKNRGVVATLLVQNGTLRKGDIVVAGGAWGRMRAMFSHSGDPIDEAIPSCPVEVMGLNVVPRAGDMFKIVDTVRQARTNVSETHKSDQTIRQASPIVDLESIFAEFESGKTQELNLVVKVDVQGSLEPIVNSLEQLGTEGLKVRLLHTELGNINENDVLLAIASRAIVIGFNVTPDTSAQNLARTKGVSIREYQVIYRLVEDVEKALQGLLEPEEQEVIVGEAEVREVFKISKLGQIAGCYMRSGEFRRKALARVVRGDKVVHDGNVSSLKHEKDDVNQVRKGFECGIGLKDFQDFEVGDSLQCYVLEEVR